MSAIRQRWKWLIISGVIVVLDHLTKIIAREYLSSGEIVKVFGNDLVWLVLVFNSGSAFGLRILPPLVLMIVSLLASLVLIIYIIRAHSLTSLQAIPLSIILGGAIGNFIDRVTIGEVTDFISVDFPDFIMPRFPVFNLADSAVSVGVTLLILVSLWEGRSSPAKAGEQLETPPVDEAP